MGNSDKAVWAMVITIVILIAVFSGFWLTLFWKETPEVVLPAADPTATQVPPDDDELGAGGDILVEVDPQTVQAVVATLSRPESYYREITRETFWGEDGVATSTAQVWVDGGYTRIDSQLPDGTVEHTIVGGGKRYRWYDDQWSYYSVDAGEDDADLMQRIPTYEDILALDIADITATGYEAKGDLGCIYVETAQDVSGYRERYWVSVDQGLLVAAETVKDEQVVLRISAYSVEIPVRDGTGFTLPNGTVLHMPTVF